MTTITPLSSPWPSGAAPNNDNDNDSDSDSDGDGIKNEDQEPEFKLVFFFVG